MAISVSVISNKTIASNQILAQRSGGRAVHIQAIRGGQYLLAASGKERSPENITVKRVGNNLHVALEGSDPDQPELIIEGFFSNQGQLVGLAEDGIYYEYVATDGDDDSSAAFLMEGVSSPLALGKQPLLGFADGLVVAEKDGFGMLPWLLGGLAVAGGAAAAGGGGGGKGNGNGNGDKVVDTTPPTNKGIGSVIDDKGPIQGGLNNGDVTDDNRPTLGGKGQDPGDKITIIDNGKAIGEAVVDGNGNWTFTPEQELGDGEHAFEVVVTDPSGNSSGPSEDLVLIIDTTPPVNKGIEDVQDDQGAVTGSVSDGDHTDDSRPTLSGSGDAGDVVTIIDNGKVIGEVQVGDDGKWSFTPEDALDDGEHAFEVIITDPAGNSSEPSDDYLVIIDSAPLFKPTIDLVEDDEGELRGPLSSGDVTDDARPTISGTGKPNSMVSIKDNGVEIGRALVNAEGRWTLHPELPLSMGGHVLIADTVDTSGKASNPSDAFEFAIGSLDAPAVPAITAVLDDVGSITGGIQKNGVTDDARPTINGTAQAGMTVSVYIDGELAGTTQADMHGEWSFTPQTDLADGLHEIAATASNAVGVVSPKTGEYPILVDTTAPLKPGQDAAVLLDDQSPQTGAIINGTITDDNTPSFVGKAEPNAKVLIHDGELQIGEESTDAEGNWVFTPSPALKDGSHEFSYLVVDAAGNVGPKSEVIKFEVDTSKVVVSIEGADDAVGSSIGPIAKGGVTDDPTPTVHGKATAGGVVSIYEGETLLGQALADAEGNWKLWLGSALTEGEHRLEATVTTGAAGESERSAVFDFTVDVTAPQVPTIDQVNDDVGVLQGLLNRGESTDDTTPTLSGKAEGGSTVHILDNGSLIGKVSADAEGNWSFTPSPPLLNGQHDFTATAEDKAGNVSVPSDVFTITIDTVPPDAPVITSVYDDQGDQHGLLSSGDATDDVRPTISGTAEANSTVIIMDAGVEIGKTVADAAGAWTFEPDPVLALGEHSLSAIAQDAAGNASRPSAEFDLTVASPAPPEMPLITEVMDDVGSIQGLIARDGVTDDARPAINGTAQAGVTISVYINGELAGTSVADGSGAWWFIPTEDLAEGLHNITAKASNGLGNTSLESQSYPIHVDTLPPLKPGQDDAQLLDDVGQITGQIVNGTVTDDNTPSFVGRAEANVTVVIYDDGLEIGRVTADDQGRWGFMPSTPLLDGEYSFTYQLIDQAGGTSPMSDPIAFTVDTAQVGVTLEGALDDAGLTTGDIAPGGITDDSTPTLYGKSNSGGIVKIYEGTVLLGQTVVGEDGSWHFTPDVALSEGTHNLHATVTTAAHGESSASDAFTLTVDLTPPGTPSIEAVMDDVGSLQGLVLSGQYTDDATPTLHGKADADAVVNLYDNGLLLGSVVADANGHWSFTPGVPLGDGIHEFSAQSVDTAGNASGLSNLYTVMLDYTPPASPTIDSAFDDQGDMQGTLVSGASTDDAKPVLSGKAEAGTTIIIRDQGIEVGRVVADASGRWSHEPILPLLQGTHMFTASAVDAAGNTSAASNVFQISVLTDARPLSPAIHGVMDDAGAITGIIQKNAATDDVRPTIFGSAQAGSIVSVYINDVLLGTAAVDGKGSWSFTPTVDIPDGLHYFSATSSSGGLVSARTGNYPVLFDSTPPSSPTVEDATLWDLVGDSISVISNGTVTDDRTPAFVGKTEANATIIIYDAGVEIGRARSNESGNWMFSPMPVLVDGAHQLSYAVMDAAGNLSAKSPAISFIVDTSGLVVSIEGADDDVGTVQGAISDGGTTDDTRPSFHGKATPGGIVTLFAGALVIGQTVAGADGSWRFTVETALPQGLHSVTAKVFTEAGGQSAASPTFYLVVDTNAPAKPSIELMVDDVGGQQGRLIDGQSTDDGTPTLAGWTEAGSVVRIYDNNSLLGSVVADSAGVWVFTPTTLLNNGKHVFTVTSTDEAGNLSPASDPFTVIVDTVAAAAPTIDSAYDDQGDMQGTLASGASTDDAKPVLSGKAEANAIIIVKDNGIEIGRTVVGSNGRWSFEPKLPLAQGAHAFTAEALDAAGNISAPSKSFSLQVFIGSAPGTATITAVTDDVGSITGAVQKDGLTNDSRPTISGTAPMGMMVSVYIDDVLVGSTMADGRGYWSFTPGNALADGVHYISASSTDGLGGVTSRTGSYPIVVDTMAPTKPGAGDATLWGDVGQVIGQIGSDSLTNDATPTFKGTAVVGTTIVIHDKGVEIGRVPTDAAGGWSFTPYPPLADGQHRFSYSVMDASGNSSPKSDELAFIVNTSALSMCIDGAQDNSGTFQGGFATGSITDDKTPTLFGRAVVGSTVKIYEGSILLGTAEASIDGNWRFTPTQGLAEGVHNLHITVTPINGQESGPSALFNLIVDSVAPDTPSIDSVSNDVGKIQGALVDGQTGDDATPTLAGRAEVGSTVSIYDNGSLLGQAVSGVDGRWSFTPTTPLINGSHVFTATSTDTAGNTSALSAPHMTIIDTEAPDKPTIDAAYDDQGAMQGTLASGDDTDDRQPVFNGKAEAESTVVIMDNGIEIGRVIADVFGRWSYSVAEPLGLGEHAFTLSAMDSAGNVSVPSDSFRLTVVLDASVDPLLYPLELIEQPETAFFGVADSGELASLNMSSVLVDTGLLIFQDEAATNGVLEPSAAGVSEASLQLSAASYLQQSWLSMASFGAVAPADGTGGHALNDAAIRSEDMLKLYAM